MSTTALGIAPDSDGSGVTPLTHRKVQQYQWASTGVCGGLEVSGGTGLTYTVAEGMAVTTRGDSDGYALAYYEGGTIATTAGDTSNPRYDVLWLSAHDISQGDDDNLVTLGITQGTPAASPAVPDVDSDCTVIDTLYVPAGMTMTSSCDSTGDPDYAIPYGASLGVLAHTSFDRAYVNGGTMGSYFNSTYTKVPTEQGVYRVYFTLPTDRWVDIVLDYRMNIKSGDFTTYGSCYVELYLGNDADSETLMTDTTDDGDPANEILVTRVWRRGRMVVTLYLTAGNWQGYFNLIGNNDCGYYPTYRGVMDTYVYDRGVAQ